VEDVLDRLLPIVPGGVREVRSGRHVELRMRGAALPSRAAIAQTAGRWSHRLWEHEVSDDWRQRRIDDYEPDLVSGRLHVRPEWAPSAPGAEIEIVLAEAPAFGGGTHPTTRTCLEWLLSIEPHGSFADLGCGTGVLAILAAKLGFAPVAALDFQAESVAAASANVTANGVAVSVRAADLYAQAPPPANTVAANVPAALHVVLAAELGERLPARALVSGFGLGEAPPVFDAYARGGLRESRRLDANGWVVALLERD
jgi:ribosomal protein L11 methyltransferase